MALRRLSALDVSGRAVFVRVDINCPISSSGDVADDTRIVASLPTLRYLLDKGARVVLASHLGRPKGKRDPKQSLKPVHAALSRYLKSPIGFSDSIVGAEAEAAAARLAPGEALLLENLRFDPREEANDVEFSRALARLGEAYVNDAFGSAHRAHASTVGITAFLADRAAGFLMEKELSALGKLLEGAESPYVVILGGAKISGKIDVVRNLLARADRLLVGGGMMFTFLRAGGLATGRSLVEEEKVAVAAELLASADGAKILLPEDCRVAADPTGNDEGRVVPVSSIPPDAMGVDIGPSSLTSIGGALAEARTVFWNGPMGIFEVPCYAAGTIGVAREVANATRRGAFTVVGGGDSLAAVHAAEVEHQISHLSTGGGASLEFLEGRELPGVAALEGAPRPA